jgi:1-pyrroline-5-carboxylate dehydrogenase
LWQRIAPELTELTNTVSVADVRDLDCFTSAVIDQAAWRQVSAAIEAAQASPTSQIIAGGRVDDRDGWYIWPTIVKSSDPTSLGFTTEYFGPLLNVYVYPDSEWDFVIDLVGSTSPYGLTGSVLSTDRAAIVQATEQLRLAAGNFYINDKPTGTVVGQQPFGGSRASGTNDKNGSIWHLCRWLSPRTIKESFSAPITLNYPAPRTTTE